MGNEEELFKALLDEPEDYEVKGQKIPIYSLGVTVMSLLTNATIKIPKDIKDKILSEEKLTVDEEKILTQLQNEEKGEKNTLMKELLIKTLKLTFPNKSEEELGRISMEHWNPLIKIIMRLNFPKLTGEQSDFQKAQPKKN